jgi:hypothetical protein
LACCQQMFTKLSSCKKCDFVYKIVLLQSLDLNFKVKTRKHLILKIMVVLVLIRHVLEIIAIIATIPNHSEKI